MNSKCKIIESIRNLFSRNCLQIGMGLVAGERPNRIGDGRVNRFPLNTYSLVAFVTNGLASRGTA
jgi:hypothetical protein